MDKTPANLISNEYLPYINMMWPSYITKLYNSFGHEENWVIIDLYDIKAGEL